jgi:murein L,D-transpeptidase YcbB/YkuD
MGDRHTFTRQVRSRGRLARDITLALALAATGPAAVLLGPRIAGHAQAIAQPQKGALRQAVNASADDGLRKAYAARDYRPIWFEGVAARPEARRLLEILNAADDDGLNPTAYGVAQLSGQL